ncbi:RNA polymerase sigma factor [Dactylosporangium matsuzakiense]|uniref:RNA polymerase sigma factor n=1 Tax=Dactylosporangium matsuzakiense TaxID=53360 RepID=UPI0022F2E5EA|nr:sigma-70 family RNA polymerase sigma factor [Dactylosporangium matsuzakiense]
MTPNAGRPSRSGAREEAEVSDLTLDNVDPAALLDRAAEGDQDAWLQLVRQYAGLLRSVAASLRMAAGDAEDAAQTTWLGLLQNLDTLRDPSRVSGWLATSMRRNCLRLVRRARRELPVAEWTDVEWADRERAEQVETIEDRLLRTERDHQLWQAVDRLPDRQGQLVRVLFADPDTSYDDVARRMSIAVGTVGPARRRALRRLAQLLSQDRSTTVEFLSAKTGIDPRLP